MGPLDLQRILKPLSQYSHPDLIVGLKTSDDAAVFHMGGRAMIQTVDFFAPVVDDPYTYGAVAAANAMSDVYAMGGEVLFALNIAAFPEDLPQETVSAIVQGGAEKVAEAGGLIVGGHTVIDREPKYGLCVTGIADPGEVMTKDALRPGDALVLTKPIGTGTITTAHKADRVAQEDLATAMESMLQLNWAASRSLRLARIRACTDVTGFGLLGHASEMAEASGVKIRIRSSSVPLLPGARSYAEAGILPGGVGRNRDYLFERRQLGRARVQFAAVVVTTTQDLLMDPQTSGGLLAGIPADRTGEVLGALEEAGVQAWVIGEALEGAGVEVV